MRVQKHLWPHYVVATGIALHKLSIGDLKSQALRGVAQQGDSFANSSNPTGMAAGVKTLRR